MHYAYTYKVEDRIAHLDEQEALHCIKVLRLRQGDKLILLDGKANLYDAEFIGAEKKEAIVAIISKTSMLLRPFTLHIAIAPTKNIDRFEWFVEKSVEIGIDKITPIICNRSERKNVNIERTERLVLSAVKQSISPNIPSVSEAIAFNKFIEQCSATHKYIAHCSVDDKCKLFSNLITPKSDYLILIGPEGDFDDEELKFAKTNGFISVSLGDMRLRTETAGLFACMIACIENQK